MTPITARLLEGRPGVAGPGSTGGANFQELLFKSMEQVNQLDQQSQSAIAQGLTENDLTQAEVLISVKKADLAFRTMLQVRNKILDAYNELKQMRM